MTMDDEIGDLTREVNRLANTISSEKDARRRGNRVVTTALLVVLVFALFLWHAIDDINSTRAEARVATCHSANTTTRSINHILGEFNLPTALLLPERDCTSAGITAYYKAPK